MVTIPLKIISVRQTATFVDGGLVNLHAQVVSYLVDILVPPPGDGDHHDLVLGHLGHHFHRLGDGVRTFEGGDDPLEPGQ